MAKLGDAPVLWSNSHLKRADILVNLSELGVRFILDFFQHGGSTMPQPLVASVTIDGNKFHALSASVSFSTTSDRVGMPMMGTFVPSIEICVDLDKGNMPFDLLQKLFDLAKLVTKDKIKDIKIEFWQDDSAQDVVCAYTLKGWISHWHTSSGNGGNHVLMMSIQPALDQNNFSDLAISN